MKESIRRFIPLAISAVTIIVTLIVQFAVFSINDEFSWSEFLPNLIINIFLLVTTAVVWINSGTDRAKREENSAYKINAGIYAKQIAAVTADNRLGELREFCRIKTEEMRDNKITVLLANVGIDRNTYDSALCKLTRIELKGKNYTRRQIRTIRRIQDGRVRVKPVRAMDLLSDSKTPDDCGVNYDEQTDKALRISFRALRSVFIALISALLAIDPAQDITNIAAWVMFFLRLFTIVVTAYNSEHEGYARITETKNKVILRRIAFLHEFDEWAGTPRLNKGNSQTS
ncbi:MAG: hypothetical protein K2M89_06425 [Clostridiales bacterium]|nr:hypothetical protein [Clostridiales bacterium]